MSVYSKHETSEKVFCYWTTVGHSILIPIRSFIHWFWMMFTQSFGKVCVHRESSLRQEYDRMERSVFDRLWQLDHLEYSRLGKYYVAPSLQYRVDMQADTNRTNTTIGVIKSCQQETHPETFTEYEGRVKLRDGREFFFVAEKPLEEGGRYRFNRASWRRIPRLGRCLRIFDAEQVGEQ